MYAVEFWNGKDWVRLPERYPSRGKAEKSVGGGCGWSGMRVVRIA